MSLFLNSDVLQRLIKQQEQMQSTLQLSEYASRLIQPPTSEHISRLIQPPIVNSALIDSLISMGQLMNSTILPSTFSGIYAHIAKENLAQLQQLHGITTNWLQQIQPAIPPIHWQLLSEQTTMMERMTKYVAVLGGIHISLPEPLLNTWRATSNVVKHLRLHQQEILPTYTAELVRNQPMHVETLVFAPTFTTAALVHTTYGLVEDCLNEEVTKAHAGNETGSSFTTTFESHDIKGTVATLLAPIGQRFVMKWNGAWETMMSRQSDCHSQATHSARELLMQLLAELAPDTCFPPEPKVTRKMRVKYILEGKKGHPVDFITSCANAIDSLYDILCGEAHRRDDHLHDDTTIIGYLYAVGGMITTLLTYPRRDQNEHS